MASTFGHVHSESSSRNCPELLAATKGWELPGSIALPSQTISFASIIAFGACMGLLLSNEVTKYFFRLSFNPVILAAPASFFAWYIGWRGSLRPGPLFPRLWNGGLAILDSALLIISLLLRPFTPLWSHPAVVVHAEWTRYIDPLVVASVSATLLLLPRLYPMHPLRTLVQTIAPMSLIAVLSISIPLLFRLVNGEVDKERQTILSMADSFDQQTESLRKMGQAGPLGNDENSLTTMPELNFPDKPRWKAAEILERAQLMTAGKLHGSSLALIIAIRDLYDKLPPKIACSYFPDSYEPTLGTGVRFTGQLDPKAKAVSGYFYSASTWLPVLNQFGRHDIADAEDLSDAASNLADQARQSQERISGAVNKFKSSSDTWWLAHLSRENDPAAWQELLGLTLGRSGLALSSIGRWDSSNLFQARDKATQVTSSAASRRLLRKKTGTRDIEIPDPERDSSHPDQTIKVSVDVFDVKRVFDYFTYFPSSPGEAPFVVGLRLAYEASDLQGPYPKDGQLPSIRWDAKPQGRQIWIEVPDGSERAEFVANMLKGLKKAVEQRGGSIESESGTDCDRRFYWSSDGKRYKARTWLVGAGAAKSALIIDLSNSQ